MIDERIHIQENYDMTLEVWGMWVRPWPTA